MKGCEVATDEGYGQSGGLNGNADLKNDANASQEHFWKCSTRPNDFLEPNLVFPQLLPDLKAADRRSPGVDPSLIKR